MSPSKSEMWKLLRYGRGEPVTTNHQWNQISAAISVSVLFLVSEDQTTAIWHLFVFDLHIECDFFQSCNLPSFFPRWPFWASSDTPTSPWPTSSTRSMTWRELPWMWSSGSTQRSVSENFLEAVSALFRDSLTLLWLVCVKDASLLFNECYFSLPPSTHSTSSMMYLLCHATCDIIAVTFCPWNIFICPVEVLYSSRSRKWGHAEGQFVVICIWHIHSWSASRSPIEEKNQKTNIEVDKHNRVRFTRVCIEMAKIQ